MGWQMQGGAQGAMGGAAAGATLGSVVPGIGTVVGGIAGGLAGGVMGGFGGSDAEKPEIMYPIGAARMRRYMAPRLREDIETGGYGPQEMAQLQNMYQRALTRQREQVMRGMKTQMSRAGTYDSGLAYRTGQEMHRQGAQSMERGLNSLLQAKIAARAQAMGRGLDFGRPIGMAPGTPATPPMGPMIAQTGAGALGGVAGMQKPGTDFKPLAGNWFMGGGNTGGNTQTWASKLGSMGGG